MALLAIGSFTFANDGKGLINKTEGIEIRTVVISAVEDITPPGDICTITITAYKTTTVGGTTFVDKIEATGTGADCDEALADARASLYS
uniref:hypothetical protein n=1 Tax=Flavobacterium sp. TaxID=239 RepID=UPI0040481A92